MMNKSIIWFNLFNESIDLIHKTDQNDSFTNLACLVLELTDSMIWSQWFTVNSVSSRIKLIWFANKSFFWVNLYNEFWFDSQNQSEGFVRESDWFWLSDLVKVVDSGVNEFENWIRPICE